MQQHNDNEGMESVDADDLFAFSAAAEAPPASGDAPALEPALILVVDDDAGFRESMSLALRRLEIDGRSLRVLQADSAAQATSLLLGESDIAVILLDVAMESDRAGLDFVRSVRDVMGNAEVRIVLVTGEPSLAPMTAVLGDLDVNDYWLKTELSLPRLRTVISTNLRDHHSLQRLCRARQGLQMIVDSSRALIESRTLQDFASRVLAEIARLLGAPADGVLVAAEPGAGAQARSALRIVSSSGRLAVAGNHAEALPPDVAQCLRQALELRSDVLRERESALFIAGDAPGQDYACYVACARPINATERELLRLFSLNIESGLRQVRLISRLDRAAFRDSLLDLPNRAALLRQLEQVMAAPDSEHALLLVDIDGFSEINLTLGFGYGDELLRELAQQLCACFAPPSVVARLHDDVFAVLGPASVVNETVLHAALSREASAIKRMGMVTSRLSLREFDGTATRVLATASLLLKMGKRGEVGRHVEYRPGLEQHSASAHQLLDELREAIAADQLHVDYQPQMDLRSGHVTGLEVLARWNRAGHGPVSPAVFIALAERSGDILALGERVLEHALAGYRRLARGRHRKLRIAVNISARQFAEEGFVDQLLAMLEREQVPTRALELEVTESVAMHDFDAIYDRCLRLREAGVQLAIDDFGTGFSSLAYLKRLPFDCIKVDRSFIAEIGHQGDTLPIAELIIQLADRLGCRVIAEGVESDVQVRWLTKRGCRHGQGFGLGRPMAIDDVEAWLARH